MTRSRVFVSLIVVLVLLGVSLLALPTIIRALPGRYAYYLPEQLQALRHNTHPELLPTAVPVAMTRSPSPTLSPTPPPTWTPRATQTPSPPPTALPSETPTPSPTATPIPPVRFVLNGLRHEHQGWNNCGPATVAMTLSYWGRDETQYEIAPVLKPDPEDKNVSPSEIESYVRDLGLGAIVRVGGTLNRLKALLRAGFPVIAETWYVRDAHDQLGHYRLLIGYDDSAQQFITYDSLHGSDVPIGYQELDELWRVFNRVYLVVYAMDRWEELAWVLGPDLNDSAMYEQALQTARLEAADPPQSCVAYAACTDWVTFSHFNIGSSLKSTGQHAEAATAFDEARRLGLHYRMLWYQFGPYESYHAVGRQEDVVALANATLATTGNLEESYYWRGRARLARGDVEGARSDFNTALHFHVDWPPAVVALAGMENSP